MVKDRSLNPAAAQHKADKARAVKKNKASVAAQRNERLAKRNPERLQRQIDELKLAEERGEPLRPRDRDTLNSLERDVRAIRKAREALGDRAPAFGGRGERVLGKRRRGDDDGRGRARDDDTGSRSSATDEDVRDIPMPRDTPPPVPRKPRKPGVHADAPVREGPHPLPAKPESGATTTFASTDSRTVYSAAPVHRDLRKEATRLMPSSVAQKLAAAKGQTPGKLLEPEELDRLERLGYGKAREDPMKEGGQDAAEAALDEEEARFEQELKHVNMEEVEDEAYTG